MDKEIKDEGVENKLPHNVKPVVYQGTCYPSIAELSRATGVQSGLLVQRLNKGWTVEEAVETAPLTGAHAVTYHGIQYPTVRSLAQDYDISECTLSLFLKQGDSIDDAVSKAVDRRRVPITLWGKNYASYSELAARFGIPNRTVLKIKQQGISLEKGIRSALEVEPILFEDRQYNNLMELCEAYHVQPEMIWRRLHHGYSLEDAVHKPLCWTRGKRTEYHGEIYSSLTSVCRAVLVSACLVRRTMRENPELEAEEAVDILVQLKQEIEMPASELLVRIPHCVIRGRQYMTIRDYLNTVNVPEAVFSGYKNGRKFQNIIDTLRSMKQEQVLGYRIGERLVRRKDLLSEGCSQAALLTLEKKDGCRCAVPQYPQLQMEDYSFSCYDPMCIYHDLVEMRLEHPILHQTMGGLK